MLLGIFVTATASTGLISWTIGTGWGRLVTVVHAVTGLSLLVLAPMKLRGSVRVGLRRKRWTRWLSILMGGLVVAVVILGLLHATGLWHGVGYWSALWTHVVLAALLLPFIIWHIVSRPARARLTDLDRRTLVGGGAVAVTAAVAYTAQELVVSKPRRFTGSHEIASHDPRNMPTVQWLNDKSPSVPASGWDLIIGGQPVALDTLRQRSQSLEADLDCTGGWWSRQTWDAVALDELIDAHDARSLEVTSATGYSRLFPVSDINKLFLAVGYSGLPLRRGHGAPVRLVAPGRRGFWWVKWVNKIELSQRPWWLQSPFPLE